MNTQVAHCSGCAWIAYTPQDMELIADDGSVVELAHIGCPECGGMIILDQKDLV